MIQYADIAEEVVKLHEQLRLQWPHLRRIALALYDPSDDELRTFVNATEGGTILAHYSTSLSNVPSLLNLATEKNSRIIDDLSVLSGSNAEHSQAILSFGFHSSFTVPMFNPDDSLLGFIFYDADEPNFFTSEIRKHLELYSELLRSLVMADVFPIKMLQAAVNLTRTVTHYRDEETGEHIARMAHYTRIIGAELADQYGLNDLFLHYMLLYAPLHDIGKIAVPDTILVKNGPLDPDEYAIMQTHVTKGVEIINNLIHEFGLNQTFHSEILLNIISYHHERYDGKGYPYGLQGDQIPIESRIASVADVFDALTSDRPYRKAWSVDETFHYLQAHRGTYFDPDCVDALVRSRLRVLEIKEQFQKDEPTVS